MTTSSELTLDHINAFFSLSATLEPIDIVPTATGGTGIDNRSQFPAPEPSVPAWRRAGTDYVKHYTAKEMISSIPRRLMRDLPDGSLLSINSLEDIDDTSTAVGDTAVLNELDDETTQQIYSTYFNVPNRTYDSELTITSYREEILRQLNIHPVVIIQGPTGCGKTTQVPQYILDYHQSRGTYCNIIVTQPRKIAAISIARRVCQERKWQLGTIVGYQVAMDPKTSSDTRLNYVTTGVLLEKLVNAKRMDMYTHIIIDEVHERNQDIDFALLLVKKFLKTNSQRVKVILMSATFDSTSFAKYFSLSSRGDCAPVIEIVGKSKDVTEHYLHELKLLLPERFPEFNMLTATIDPCLYDCVLKLIHIFDRIEKTEQKAPSDSEFAPSRGAVLIFLPGYEEICALTSKLQFDSIHQKFWIIPLHSSITVDEQTKVFKESPADHRKIIISTNIAESSITVPDVKYVIDFCLTKNLVTDLSTNYTCLQLEWASKANCIQRKGRAGRVDIGKVYRMVPLEFYKKLPDYGIPEIKRCPLTSTILHVKKLNICEPKEMLAFAIDPPDLSDIGNAVIQLKEALALTAKGNNPFDGDLTFIGRVMANLPLDIKLSKLIIFGYVFHCLEECIIIAASLSLQSFFARPFQKELDAYRSRLAWADNTFSDCLAYLNAYNMWKQLSIQGQFKKPGGLTENQWALRNFIQIRRIKEVDLLVKEIKSRLEKLQICIDHRQRYGDEELNTLILKMIIAGAFFPYYYMQEKLDEQVIDRSLNKKDPLSTVVVHGLPKHHLLYASALRDLLSCCSNNVQFEYMFEESNAYITFPRNPDSNSMVLQAVYLAVKMRLLRKPLELSVFSPEEAERKYKQILSSQQNSEKPTNRLSSNRVTVKCSDVADTQSVLLPSISNFFTTLFIPHVENCGKFWARSLEKTSHYIKFLETSINVNQGRHLLPLRFPPKINVLYLAPYHVGPETPLYYRARVVDINENKVKVFFIDYGNTEFIDTKELREIDEDTPDVATTKALAFECHLKGVKPSSIKSVNGKWCKEANTWFKNTVNGAQLHARIYSIVQGIVRVELRKETRDRTHQDINMELIRRGYAEPAEESLSSRENNELRLKASEYTSSYVNDSLDDLSVAWKDTSQCDLTKTGRKVRLEGPYSPLEVSYSGLTNIDRCKHVKVDWNSVNSISLNSEPQDPYTSMLVAAHVGVGKNNQELVARNTTIMPKMRGLPALICLLFSPYAEIRTDKNRRSYTGALCGLGFDSETGESLYPDHDLELEFDIELDLNDIREINAIRMGFNLLLNSESDTLQCASVGVIQEKTRKTVNGFLQHKRKPREPVSFTKPCQWNQIPPELLLEAAVESNADCAHVFPLHKPASLSVMEDKNREMRAHMTELYDMVEQTDRRTHKEFRLIRCKLCSEDLNCVRDLLVHLDSPKHQMREERLTMKNR